MECLTTQAHLRRHIVDELSPIRTACGLSVVGLIEPTGEEPLCKLCASSESGSSMRWYRRFERDFHFAG